MVLKLLILLDDLQILSFPSTGTRLRQASILQISIVILRGETRTMRRFFLLILFIFLTISFVFADDEPFQSYKIHAYKVAQSAQGEIPSPTCVVRILNAYNSTITEGETIEIPQEERNVQYSAFSWVVGGNVYGKVELKFQFFPMFRYRISDSSEDGYQCIPYAATIEHVESRIGNRRITTVTYGGTKYNSTYSEDNTFTGTTYHFYYVDAVSGSGSSCNVSDTSVNGNGYLEVGMDYYMNYSTVIKSSDDTVIKTNSDYGLNVCEYWNRTGSAKIQLKIASDGSIPNTSTKYADGLYYASVRVLVQAQ